MKTKRHQKKSVKREKAKVDNPAVLLGSDSKTIWFFHKLMHASILFLRNATFSSLYSVLAPQDYIIWLNFVVLMKQDT